MQNVQFEVNLAAGFNSTSGAKEVKRGLKIRAPNIQFSNPKYSNDNDLQPHVHCSKNKKKKRKEKRTG